MNQHPNTFFYVIPKLLKGNRMTLEGTILISSLFFNGGLEREFVREAKCILIFDWSYEAGRRLI